MTVPKKRQKTGWCPATRISLTDLPDELLVLIIQYAKHVATQCVLQRTCKTLQKLVENIPIKQLTLSTYHLFGARMMTPHYSKDLQRFADISQQHRLRFLRRLSLLVNTPSFAVGCGRRGRFHSKEFTSLRHFAIESTLSRQMHSRLPLSGPGLCKMMQLMPNLITLSVADVPNLASGFFKAVQNMRGLRNLLFTRCSMSVSFAAEYGALGYLTGKCFPPDVTRLKLDIQNLNRAILMATPADHLFLSSMTNLAELELEESAHQLTSDMWYTLRSIDMMSRSLVTFKSSSPVLCSLFEFAKEMLGPTPMGYTVKPLIAMPIESA